MSLFGKANRRFFYRHPRHLLLAVLGIALGVAVMTGIDLSLASAQRAFERSLEAVVGQATHSVVGGEGGLNETLYPRLRVDLGFRRIAPVVEGYASHGDLTLRLLGIDPFAERELRGRFEQSARGLLPSLLGEPDTALLGRATAERLGLRKGDSLVVEALGQIHGLKVLGTIEGEAAADPALEGLLLVDIATAQEILQHIGRLDRIDLALGEDSGEEARLRAALPRDAVLQSAEGRNAATARMTEAFAINLRAMSGLALLAGTFLIYNTLSFNFLQRRPLLGTLRVLGATRGQILAEVLLESAALGALGALLGLALALLAANGLLHLVTRTINDMYFVLAVSQLLISPTVLARGFLIGVFVAVLAALAPALEAVASPPAAVLRRSVLERRAGRLSPWLALTGASLMLLAYGLLTLESAGPAPATGGVVCLALGYSLITPALLAGTIRLCRGGSQLLRDVAEYSSFGKDGSGARPAEYRVPWPGSTAWRPLPRFALRGLRGSLSRTGMALAALTLSVAIGIGTAVMIHSFRSAVADWLDRLLQADIHVSLPMAAGWSSQTLPPGLLQQVASLPGVERVSSGRRVFVETSLGRSELLALQPAYPDRPAFRFKYGQGEQAWRDFQSRDGILVSEPYASRHALRIGDTITFYTDGGTASLPVLGIFFDYRSEQGVILMHRPLYDRLWHDPAVSSLGLYLAPGGDLETVRQAVYRLASGQHWLVRSNREIRAASLALFDRTFQVTQVLRLQAVGVAFIGIVSALLSLQAERGRELAILRALGVTPGQIRGLVLLQTGVLGLCAGVLALPLGWLVGDALVRVVNLRSFGWTMELAVPLPAFAEALLLAVGAALLAGLYPAWRASRIVPAAGLREE